MLAPVGSAQRTAAVLEVSAIGTPGPAAPWRDSVAVLAATLLAYGLLRHEAFYHLDARLHIAFAERGTLLVPRHILYIPILAGLHHLLAPFAVGWFAVASWLSVAGMALGVALLHRAAARCLGRADAWLAAVLIATTPAVMFFASVAELHGPFMPVVGLATLALVRVRHHPTRARALLLGAAIGASYFLHATGALLAIALPLLHGALAGPAPPRARWRQALWCAAWSAAPVGALVLGVPLALAQAWPSFGALQPATVLIGDLATLAGRLATTPRALAREWVLACVPLSVAWLAALRHARLRPLLAALVGLLAVYGAVSALLLVEVESEWGAYFLPLLWPAAILTVRSVPRPVTLALAAAGLAIGTVVTLRSDRPGPGRAFAAGVHAARDGQPALLVIGDPVELDHCYTHLPGVRYVLLPETLGVALDTAAAEAAWCAAAAAYLRDAARRDHAVLFTAPADAVLREGRSGVTRSVGAAMLHALDDAFVREPVASPGFAAWRLIPR